MKVKYGKNFYMKKLITSLATFALVGGSLSSVVALTEMHHKQTTQTSTGTVNPFDIANKLRKKTIVLDPTVWVGRNIKDFQSQLNTVIVKDGILTANEVKYVSWSSVNLKAADWYWTVNFTVSIPGASVTDNLCLDVSTGETTQQIATKLENATINFNFDFWNQKSLEVYASEVKNTLVNEGILTQAESTVVGVDVPLTITNWGQVSTSFDVNDNNTETIANVKINVLNDGPDAQYLANQIVGTDNYYISKNDQGLYADSRGPTADLDQQLIKWTYTSDSGEVKYIKPPHLILQEVNNDVYFTAVKDGQIWNSIPCAITANQ